MIKEGLMLAALTVGNIPEPSLVGKSLAPEKKPSFVGFVIDRNGCIWKSTGQWLFKIECLGLEKRKLLKE